MDIKIAVKDRIVELCELRKISINKLGTICGITQSTLKNIMSERNGATVVTIKKICDGLEITIGEFFSTPEFDALEQEIR